MESRKEKIRKFTVNKEIQSRSRKQSTLIGKPYRNIKRKKDKARNERVKLKYF